jgi:hypothetical protein
MPLCALCCDSQAVRHQAAAVLAALALSSPPLLARLLGECLEGVETFCQQLLLLAAPYTRTARPCEGTAGLGGAGSALREPGVQQQRQQQQQQ